MVGIKHNVRRVLKIIDDNLYSEHTVLIDNRNISYSENSKLNLIDGKSGICGASSREQI